LIAVISKIYVDFAAHLPECIIGDADATGFGYAFEPSGNVNAIPKHIAFLEKDVANMNANAEVDSPVRFLRLVALAHPALYFYCTTHGIDGACEFD
jgi:hypothetical protein